MIHKPVLLKEVTENLNLKKGMTVVDATLGGGGYSKAILKKIDREGKLIAIDKDNRSLENFQSFIVHGNIKNAVLIQENFGQLEKILDNLKIEKVNAVVADLGLSSDQLNDPHRGFSFQDPQAFLDMRMDQRQKITAETIVNSYTQERLTQIFWEYGNERFSRSLAKAIVSSRKEKPLRTVGELLEVISVVFPEKEKQKRKIHWATKVFQALRMEVNQEIPNLKSFLSAAVNRLEKGGRLAVVTFHSGEDKIVKKIFRENARGCICPKEFPVCRCGHQAQIKIITRKPLVPGKDEIENNPRARSAKLRVVEKI